MMCRNLPTLQYTFFFKLLLLFVCAFTSLECFCLLPKHQVLFLLKEGYWHPRTFESGMTNSACCKSKLQWGKQQYCICYSRLHFFFPPPGFTLLIPAQLLLVPAAVEELFYISSELCDAKE